MRLFIAINLPSDLKQNIKEAEGDIKNQVENNLNGKVTWVNPGIYHLTVKFCGEVSLDDYEKLKKILDNIVKEYKSFQVELTQLELWPLKKPRIIKVGIKDNKVLTDLINKIRLAIDESGCIDNKFTGSKPPHLTIARLKGDWHGDFLNQNINQKFQVKSIDIMSSELTREGPIYSLLDSFYLEK